MLTWSRSPFLRFAVAVLVVLLTEGLRFVLAPWLGDRSPFLPFTLAILGVVLWCGFGPAILASILSLGFALAFPDPRHFSVGDGLEGILFLFTATGIILFGEAINRSRRKLIESERLTRLRTHDAEELAEELNLLIDGAPGYAIYMLDLAGNVTIWNQGAERLLGWAAKSPSSIRPMQWRPASRSAIWSGRPRKAGSSRKTGGCARTVRNSSPPSRSPHYLPRRAGCAVSPRSSRT